MPSYSLAITHLQMMPLDCADKEDLSPSLSLRLCDMLRTDQQYALEPHVHSRNVGLWKQVIQHHRDMATL